MKKIIILLSAMTIFACSTLQAQSFYNFDSFIADSSFVKSNNIKCIIIRIPSLLDDTTNKEFLPYQKLCFNPFGKLATYEFDYSEKKRENLDYIEHYYNDTTARCYKSHRFRRHQGGAGTAKDSIREEIIYHYDSEGKLFFEEHHQIFISEFNEWAIGYEWYGDTLRVRYAENNKIDTVRFDEKGRLAEYTEGGKVFAISYDDLGRRAKMAYFLLNKDLTKGKQIGEYTYIYDLKGTLERIETLGYELVFTNDFMGVPMRSVMRDRQTGKIIGWEVQYEYEFVW